VKPNSIFLITNSYYLEPRSSALLNANGSKLPAAFIIIIFPCCPERMRRMGWLKRDSYSSRACRHMPQGEMG